MERLTREALGLADSGGHRRDRQAGRSGAGSRRQSRAGRRNAQSTSAASVLAAATGVQAVAEEGRRQLTTCDGPSCGCCGRGDGGLGVGSGGVGVGDGGGELGRTGSAGSTLE